MKVSQVVAAARSPVGRVVTGAVGLGLILLIVNGIGWQAVAASVAGAAVLFPLVAALEMVQLACTMSALRSLYRPARAPFWQLVRAGLIGYAVMGLAPAGRAVAEVARASMLSRFVGVGRATAAATRIQGAALLGNALITVPAIAAAFLSRSQAPWWLPLAIAGNFVLVTSLGLSVLAATRAGVGAWLGRKMPKAQKFGEGLDEALSGEPWLPVGAVAWETAGRVFQVVQCGVLLACVGGVPSVSNSLVSEGTLLVGGAIGDLVPAQLGATEGYYGLSASALGITAANAVAIALLAHLAQLLWVVVGTVVSVVWPAQVVSAGSAAAAPAPAPAPASAASAPSVPLAEPGGNPTP